MPDEPVVAASDSPPAALEYSAARRVRTRWLRLIVLIVIALLVAAVMPRMWTEFGYRVGRRAVQREMMDFTAPQDAVAYGANAIQNVPYWQSNFGIPNYFPGTETSLFIHERTSQGGTRRIVGVSLMEPSERAMIFRVASSEILSFASSSSTFPRVWSEYHAIGHWPHNAKVTFQFGQLLPSDASRFTIGYSFDNQSGTLVGQLKDDGTVTLTAKDGPLADK
jgi:hypothetical protein